MNMVDRLVGLLFLIAGLIFLICSWGAYRYDTWIEKHGERALGTVTGKKMLLSVDGDSDFRVDYTFAIKDGRIIQGSHLINKELYRQLDKESDVEICYHPEDIKRNFIKGTGVTSVGITIFSSVMGLLFAVFGCCIVFQPKASNIDVSN